MKLFKTIMTWLAWSLLLLIAFLFGRVIHGQSLENITSPADTNVMDVLDTSALVLATEQPSFTITASIPMCCALTNGYYWVYIGTSPDLINWTGTNLLATSTSFSVTIQPEDPQIFCRLGVMPIH